MLKEFLRKFLDKTITVRLAKNGVLDGLSGELQEADGDLFFHRKRRLVPHPQAPNLSLVIPAASVYFPDMPLTDLIAVEIQTETDEEARAAAESEELAKMAAAKAAKPLIQVPQMMPAPPPRQAR